MIQTQEIWLPITGYEGLYEISNMGRVKSLSRYQTRNGCAMCLRKDRFLKGGLVGRGYNRVLLCISNNNKGHYVHRLVAKHFIPNPENKPQVNHKNGIKTDNRVENLEWMTNTENNQHSYNELSRKSPWTGKFGKEHHRSKPINQYKLDGTFIKTRSGLREVEREFGISAGSLCSFLNGSGVHRGGYKREYALAK